MENILSTAEKMELLNSMQIVESSCGCGELEYCTVDDNEENRDILRKIGITEKQIEDECCPEDGEMDISNVAFLYVGASYFSGKDNRFY